MGLFRSVASRVRDGMSRTREAFTGRVRSLLAGKTLSPEVIADLERQLIESDIGVRTTVRLIKGIKEDYRSGKMTKGEEVLEYLKRELVALWPEEDRAIRYAESGPTVILVAGVNGAGKTTSVAKIARSFKDEGKSVLLGACDTYRAGAVRQLEIWSERLGVPIVRGQQGGDPAAVAFDACDAAIARGVDVLVIDTAGRLQTQEPLMRQLKKIREVVARKIPGAPHETLLVLDATTGQNAVAQAEKFDAATDLTGLFLAKLDGTAKGGVVIAVHEATGVPVKFIGVGERPEDVEAFDPEDFVEAMFAPPAAAANA